MADQRALHSGSQGNAGEAARKAPPPRIDNEALFDGRDAVILVHAGQEYLLRITRNGKLILNK
ncbi:MAG TPA: hemin uptake protein HemP [Gammaproteobacteria bacterium]